MPDQNGKQAGKQKRLGLEIAQLEQAVCSFERELDVLMQRPIFTASAEGAVILALYRKLFSTFLDACNKRYKFLGPFQLFSDLAVNPLPLEKPR